MYIYIYIYIYIYKFKSKNCGTLSEVYLGPPLRWDSFCHSH